MENILQETSKWFEEHYKSMKQKIVFILQFQHLAESKQSQKYWTGLFYDDFHSPIRTVDTKY